MKWPTHRLRAVPLVLGLLLGAVSVRAQLVLPLEFRHVLTNDTKLNFRSLGGVPISTVVSNPPGSSGLQPVGNESLGSFATPTPQQFRGFMSLGAVPGLTLAGWQSVSNVAGLNAGTSPFSPTLAAQMGLPRGAAAESKIDGGLIVLRRAGVGMPYLSRRVSFAFGQVIPPPDTDESGLLLSEGQSSSYWLPEPHSTTGHTNAAYYWSPHARRVYAIQPGPTQITWVKASPYAAGGTPAYTNPGGGASFRTNGANIFLLYTGTYIVSGSPVKTPRKMYWTQKEFQRVGRPIVIPPGIVTAVNIVYNSNFPRTVAEEFRGIGSSSPADGTGQPPLPELKTLWLDSGSLYAYNAEGRVFLELLGDQRSDGQTHVQLGIEIVDVFKRAQPLDVTTEIGERTLPPEGANPDALVPEPIIQLSGEQFAYRHNVNGGGGLRFYATRETRNENDFLVHWMESGVAGLLWPKYFGRYRHVWPDDIGKYSLYVRPAVATDAEAQVTSVLIEPENAPVIEYQDPLDQPRAKFTSDLRFYTHLNAANPAHRTLLRYTGGENIGFERVFSWLVDNLRTTNYASVPIVQTLSSWNGTTLAWENELEAPRVVHATAEVGQRIGAPFGEPGSVAGQEYVAGYIKQSEGISFSPDAYIDPFEKGFEVANRGSIIPVNAIPGQNKLEVWWFRKNGSAAGLNAGNTTLGFRTVHWPSAIGRYTIQWPSSPREIILASKLGGRGLSTAEQLGKIYFQNTKGGIGYNPNEEHAIMNGGTPFATRDDLNITTNTNNEYSSHPFVLVAYDGNDGRPAMATFKVLREKPEEGFVFDYIVPAGQLLQPPPPLNFLAKPVEGSGDSAVNYNTEPPSVGGDLPVGWASTNASGPFGHYQTFTYRDRKNDFWVYRGLHAGLPNHVAGTYNPGTRTFSSIPATTVAKVGETFRFTMHAARQDEYLALDVVGLPGWLGVQGLTLVGTPPAEADGQDIPLQLVVRDIVDLSRVTNTTVLQVRSSGTATLQAGLSLTSSNAYTGSVIIYTNRPPFLAEDPAPTNSFTLRYYYKTEPSFAWPGDTTPPPAGSIVPYLRKKDGNGGYVGDPDSKTTESLNIVYRPVWPVRDPKDSSKPLPTLPFGATLTKPAFNLPGIRDFKTAHILYQQSIALDLPAARPSVRLHDATRAKFADVKNHFAETGKIPGSIYTVLYQGRYYFPNLPPHLAERLYLDPNRGEAGTLVLVGQFKNEILGESYSLLNVLRGSDLQAVKDLCPSGDAVNRPIWEAFVEELATDVETFHENPAVPGTYIPNPARTRAVGVGDLAEIDNDNIAVDSYALSATGPGGGYVTILEASGTAFTKPGDPVAMHIFKVGGSLHTGEIKVMPSANPLSELLTLQFSGDFAGRYDEFEFEWRIAAPVDGLPPMTPDQYLSLVKAADTPRYTLGGAGIQALSDNYVIVRYRPINPSHPLYKANPTDADWSAWTDRPPALAEGWIKRVLAGINPFNQRITDLFNNQVNTDVSILTQAGRRWEGDVALNLDTINNYGLIEIYETVLRRGRSLSIESGFNYGPANDALLLAAGYLSDLYMFLGNEAWADAANPTIGIGTADREYGDIATALFSFKGQVPTVLDEELALLRGRDDFLLPGVEVTPIYNRLVWNYTRGIDSGEVIYALNYNIQEKPDQVPDGVINAEDAARMFPQGHGDAYGHYLTAIKGYYSLLLNQNFDWVPRIEAVNVLGKPVSVDYTDERKFATAAAALARAGRQVFDLTWRQEYEPVQSSGWSRFGDTRENPRRSYVDIDGGTNHPVRHWGLDHWASRVGQGTYLNWVVGNAILPEEDPIPTHEGIQKVDRQTVPELRELTTQASGLQASMDSAEGGLSPLGVPEGGLVFDVNPNFVVGVPEGTHFEQIYARAIKALGNAVAAFDDAKDVTRLMRSEQDSLVELQNSILQQETAYTNALIELYGTPYPEDVGPGKTYKQGYQGPDLLHYSYVDLPEYDIPEMWSYSNTTSWEFEIKDVPFNWANQSNFYSINLPTIRVGMNGNDASSRNGVELREVDLGILGKITNFVFKVDIGPHGYFEKPKDWVSKRRAPGQIQQAISDVIAAHGRLRHEINDTYGDLGVIEKTVQTFRAAVKDYDDARDIKEGLLAAEQVMNKVSFANDIVQKVLDAQKEAVADTAAAAAEALPKGFIAGLAMGGDLTSAGRMALAVAGAVTKGTVDGLSIARNAIVGALELAVSTARAISEFHGIEPLERNTELRNAVQDIVNQLGDAQERYWAVNERVRELDDARRALQKLLADGDRIQAEREVFRRHAAGVVQGYRTRDAAFRLFRNEKLERYKTLFDLSARYALLAANAYDYETGLLGTQAGRDFKGRILSARALGVVRDGEPQFAGSNTGDPGISGALAEMRADWDVLRGRLGFNQPDPYHTTVSYRTEKERIIPGPEGDTNWKQVLHAARMPDILADPDVRRHCMQVDNGDGLPVPGIVLSFRTTIADGYNLFGLPLAAGDHAYSPSSYANKLFGVGIAFEGYKGMGDPEPIDGASEDGGAEPPAAWFLDPDALAASPYVYLIPVGVDSMRSPPLGDVSRIRTWSVEDLAIPMPFNIGASEFSTRKLYQSSDSLTEPLFTIRKHQAFRPVSDAGLFELVFYSDSMPRFEYVNNRLIGRSVWNSQWKLVIPGRTLLADPNEGLDRFIRTVKDVKMHFQTYSYSGN